MPEARRVHGGGGAADGGCAQRRRVLFTRSPTTGDRSVIVIEGAWGLGSAVVSGEVTPDRFVVGKITGEITVRDIRDKHVMHAPLQGGGTHEVADTAKTARQCSVPG